MEKFPIFEMETTDNKITIHGAVGSIVFYDYAREEAVKQYRDHYKTITKRETLKETMHTVNEAAEKMKRTTEAIARAFSILGGIYGI